MCFASMPNIPKPTAPPTVRDANLQGVADRQRAAKAQSDTTATGPQGDQTQATTYKAKLGS